MEPQDPKPLEKKPMDLNEWFGAIIGLMFALLVLLGLLWINLTLFRACVGLCVGR